MADTTDDKIELSEMTDAHVQPGDTRPRIPLPLPVRLLAVEDMTLPAAAGLESKLDDFYVKLLGFERATNEPSVVYHAENCRLRFQVVETPPGRQTFRPVGIEVDSLFRIEHRLIELEIEYMPQKSLAVGYKTLLVLDPAGNWIELSESPVIR